MLRNRPGKGDDLEFSEGNNKRNVVVDPKTGSKLTAGTGVSFRAISKTTGGRPLSLIL
jgi:hypothetical protein